ncbi:N-acetylglucosamine-6-phosphate deacetylase [Arthrobacter sp. CAU 1506]|uniref:N-acetylglucosamine-6-phosphate deacetylase n=1 Tax=Arthrobacter sp. CAU 1506 TaxID=2560052 RepID=UPI0010ACBC5A|nr:amidohydrolase family protein [Arthrobacter sp. CAU 1506]TJY65376.1 N-acetylglucosamine-6-phosphate deacetylase [Arthrobacter sp. CAU 1506]
MSSPGQDGPTRQYVRGRIVSSGTTLDDGVVACEGDRIRYAGPASHFDPAGWQHVDLPADSLLLPGLIDTHCHGAYGGDFSSADETGARQAAGYLHRSGTTTVVASTMAGPRENMLQSVQLLGKLTGEGLLAGVHAEGPFLSPARCGAQSTDYLLAPDTGLAAGLVEAAGGHLVSMTYAPELDGADELVDLLAASGVTPSLGHTDADAATAAASLVRAAAGLAQAGSGRDRRRPLVTHLFNAMRPLHHRSPGAAAACLRAAAGGRAAVELIADGIHLDPETVLTVYELVGGANILLVSDGMAATGLGDGGYVLGANDVSVRGGVARVAASGALAGGTATLLDVVRCAVAAGVPLETAVSSASAVPAAVLGLAEEAGALSRGFRADLLVTTAGLALTAVMRGGRWLDPPPR